MRRFSTLLVANRGEIAIRVMRAAHELGLRTIGIYAHEDRFALHRAKADESWLVGRGRRPVDAYLDIGSIIEVALRTGADAVHPGYGFLSENPDFAEACRTAGLVFVGPRTETLRSLGNKVEARALASRAGVATMPASGPLPRDAEGIAAAAREVGYPLMVKASWGGGGRGMRVVDEPGSLADRVEEARREALAAFGNDEVYLERRVRRARHLEVQILGDEAGRLVHLHERDCTVQRRHQKVIERAPAPFLDEPRRGALHAAALAIGREAAYLNAGTVEFLEDADTGEFWFIEVNPRIQVEHTVTECVTGIDLVQAQIRIAAGARIGEAESGVPLQTEIHCHGHALQCRVTTEDPERDFAPDHGVLSAYRSPAGFGIRLDGGTAHAGATITPWFDSLLVKVTAWGRDVDETTARMARALAEFRIGGVASNLGFLEAVVTHPAFRAGDYTTTFIDETPALRQPARRRDRVAKLLDYVAEVTVNGHEEVRDRSRPRACVPPPLPRARPEVPLPPGLRERLLGEGPEAFARWMRSTEEVLVTDTTMRDAHQSLLATRMRTRDLLALAPFYAAHLPGLLSVECWGGATFDVSMRYLRECPWRRLAGLREAMPNLPLQMLLRGANAVGYTHYPDDVVGLFVRRAAEAGIDVFRIFDSLNWVENMRVSIEAVLETGRLCEVALCYTGNLADPGERRYTLDYYLGLAREIAASGAHVIGIKDMAGLLTPHAAQRLVEALRAETSLPVHLHTHDTSGIAAATVLAAVEAGVDAVDLAVDALSGLTSQPCMGSVLEALRHGPRRSFIDIGAVRTASRWLDAVRVAYAPFEGDARSGTSEVYRHGIPGGQYTNLREQAAGMGLADRWGEVGDAYAAVDALLGNIVKVTPTSKAVGDLALMMVAGGLTAEDLLDPAREITFPESLVALLRGEMGQTSEGFPEGFRDRVLAGRPLVEGRPGAGLPPVDHAARRREVEAAVGRAVSDEEYASALMYPRVFSDWCAAEARHGDVSVLPTEVFFFGMRPGEEIELDIEPGKTVVLRCVTISQVHADGSRYVFFEVNGQPRAVRVADRAAAVPETHAPKASADPLAVGAPLAGIVVQVNVTPGRAVQPGDLLCTLEAMKMEATVRAERAGRIASVRARPGLAVDADDLLLRFE